MQMAAVYPAAVRVFVGMSNSSALLEEEIATIAPLAEGILNGPRGRTDPGLPDWFSKRQLAAWEEFQRLPMPARTNQAWRFSNIGAFDLSPYHQVDAPSDSDRHLILDRSIGFEKTAGRLVFANDHFLERTAVSEKLRKSGVI